MDRWTWHPLYVFASLSLCKECRKLFSCILKHRSACSQCTVHAILFILSYNYQLKILCVHITLYDTFGLGLLGFWTLSTSLFQQNTAHIHIFCYLLPTRNWFCVHMHRQLSDMVVQCLRTALSVRTNWIGAFPNVHLWIGIDPFFKCCVPFWILNTFQPVWNDHRQVLISVLNDFDNKFVTFNVSGL